MRRTCADHRLFTDDRAQWDAFWSAFSQHNFRHWTDFVNGGTNKSITEVLRYSFRDTLNLEELLHEQLTDTYWEYFCNTCYFEDGAEQLLDSMKDMFQLGIITNGISAAQRKRLTTGKIEHLFNSVVISDEVGIRKPDKRIFEIALAQLQVDQGEVLFVGDSLQDDYRGAVNAGIDFCYYNRNRNEIAMEVQSKFVIRDLSELMELVGK
jgi:putative hydrolase of the HAD superfamily